MLYVPFQTGMIMKFSAWILILLSGGCGARKILDRYCSRSTPKCGFLNFGFVMHKPSSGKSGCIEICAFVPLVRFDFECGRCTKRPPPSPVTTIPAPSSPVITSTPVTFIPATSSPVTSTPVTSSPSKQQVVTPAPTPVKRCSVDRCVFGLGYAMHKGQRDTSQCIEICTFNAIILRENFSCGYCSSEGSLPPTPNPTTLSPTRKPSVSPSTEPSISSQPSLIPTVTAMPVNPDGFDVVLSIGDGVAAEDAALFYNAIDRWETVIIGDLPDVHRSELGEVAPDGCEYPRLIDDLYVCAFLGKLDGPGKVAGFARPLIYRGTDDDLGLPVTGEITFDTEDLEGIRSAGILQGLITHEIGHVLGFGLLWEREGQAGTSAQCPYVGPRATAEFNAISGCTGTTTPVEIIDTDPGTRCLHWAEICMEDELMTGILEFDDMPLSRITVASFEDLGYEVNYDSADPFGTDDLNPSCVCRRRRDLEGIHLYNHTNSSVMASSRRRLSEELRQAAIAFGLSLLQASEKEYASANTAGESFNRTTTFVGDRAVTVLMRDGDTFFDVLVTREMANI